MKMRQSLEKKLALLEQESAENKTRLREQKYAVRYELSRCGRAYFRWLVAARRTVGCDPTQPRLVSHAPCDNPTGTIRCGFLSASSWSGGFISSRGP